jgi:hypothetical protein
MTHRRPSPCSATVAAALLLTARRMPPKAASGAACSKWSQAVHYPSKCFLKIFRSEEKRCFPLPTTCLKTGENWQGSGKADGGGFIGAVLQSLVFVPVLSVVEKNGQSFEALSASADIKEPWTRFDGSLGKLLRLNTVYEEKKDVCDNVLLELMIAQVLKTFVFSLAEIVNSSIHDLFEEEMKQCLGYEALGLTSSVYIVRGPVKRPGRAIA